MVYRIEYAARADKDIYEAASYIRRDSPEAARRWLAGLRRRIERLLNAREAFALIPESEWLGGAYRAIHHHSHRVIYRIDGKNGVVHIVRSTTVLAARFRRARLSRQAKGTGRFNVNKAIGWALALALTATTIVYLNSRFNRAKMASDSQRCGIDLPAHFDVIAYDDGFPSMDDGYEAHWTVRSDRPSIVPFAPLRGKSDELWNSNLDYSESMLHVKHRQGLVTVVWRCGGLVYAAFVAEEGPRYILCLDAFPNSDIPTEDAVE